MRHAKISLICLLGLCLIALIAGCGSTVSGDPGSFSLSATPSVTIQQGQTETFTVTPSAANGLNGSIQVSVSGMPAGVTVSPSLALVSPGKATTFTLTAASNATVGTTSLVVHGQAGTVNAQTTVSLTVTAASTSSGSGDFTLTASPTTLALTPGGNGQVTLSSTGSGGFSGTIAVAVKNLPTGVTVSSPATISLTPNNPVVVTLAAAADAPATTSPVQVSFIGTSGTLSHTATIQVTVNAVGPTGPDFAVTAAPNTTTVAQGEQSDRLMIGVTGIDGFTGDVAISISGLPTGVHVIPPTISQLEPGWTAPIVFVAADDAAIGNATVTITGTSGVLTHTTTVALSVTGPPPADFVGLTLSPTSETVTVGSIATVSVTATATQGYTGPIDLSVENLPAGITVLPATAVVTAGASRTFTVVATANAQPGSATVTFLGQVNSVNGSADLSLTIVSPSNNGPDVPTWHMDAGRTGLNANETSLTPTSVTSSTFGEFGVAPTDGPVDAQPLYISNLMVNGQSHNVIFAATENDSVFAWDLATGPLWQVSAIGSNETTADNQGCSELGSEVGITATPVIDRYYGPDGAIFFVAKTKDSDGNYHQRLHALDLTTGAELSGSPVDITATSGSSTFDPGISVERAALLINNGIVYLTWGAPCHQTAMDYSGWVMAYNEGTLEQLSVLDVTPQGSGGGIWMSGAGPAADTNGDVFLSTSTGTFDTTLASGKPKNGDYGNGFLKIEAPNGAMTVYDYFEPLNGVPGAQNYADQGSGGVMLLPGVESPTEVIPQQLIGAGKDGNIYQMSSAGTMGEYNGTTDNNYQTQSAALPNGATSTAAYFNNAFYYGGSGDVLKQFTVNSSGANLGTESSTTLGTAGATPVISANGTSTPILWALDTTANGGAVLHAYDATNLTNELYNSTQVQGRDTIGTTDKHAVPVVANGFVFVGTQNGLAVFGLLAP